MFVCFLAKNWEVWSYFHVNADLQPAACWFSQRRNQEQAGIVALVSGEILHWSFSTDEANEMQHVNLLALDAFPLDQAWLTGLQISWESKLTIS